MRIMMVQTTLLATMIMMQEKYVPISGVSLLGGCMLETMFMNIVRDINTVISRVTFSPESGGKLKPSTAILRNI